MTTTTTMPADVLFGKVVGRFILAVGDSIDADRMPDANPAVGTITFTPLVPNMKTTFPSPATVVKVPIVCTLDTNGRLVDPNKGLGVWLVTGMYRVTYSLQGVVIDGHTIEVLTDHTDDAPLDLTNALPPSGPSLTPTQYSELAGRLDAIDFPVDSVNGQLGTVILFADDVGAYSKIETDDKFATQQALSDAKFQQVDQQLEAIDYPVDSVNGKTGTVVLDAFDVGALTKEQADQSYAPADIRPTGTYKGAWDSGVIYESGDLVTILDHLWAATKQNQNVQPSINNQMIPSGGDGGPGNYSISQMYGNVQEILHPIKLNQDVLVGSISVLVQETGRPAMSVGIAASLPAMGGSLAAQLITPATSVAAKSGAGWHEIILDDPIQLKAGTPYWIFMHADAGLGQLNGMFQGNTSYSGSLIAPSDPASSVFDVIRGTTSSAWGTHDRHTYVQIARYVPPTWEALADNTGTVQAPPVTSVNGKTGAVSLVAGDVNAYTKTESDNMYPLKTASYTKAEADARFVAQGEVKVIDVLTQAEYDALTTKVATTLYLIVG